ncbi:MAG: proton-conducting transporter membrane subunit [Alsobacter sp.]
MPFLLAWLPALAPLLLAAAGLLAHGTTRAAARRASLAAQAGAAGALAAMLASAALLAAAGGWQANLTQAAWSAGVRLDALTGLVGTLVAFIGAVVTRFSVNYLDGNPGQARFMRWLCLTLAAVLAMILAPNLLQFAAGWIATSLALHRLLLFYPGRPGAQRAARFKFAVSRLGDACLVGAVVLLWAAFGTPDFASLAAKAEALRGRDVPAGVALAGLLVVGAALMKSAQVPLHGWLPEVVETPTPVSALLHAGLINAGGFLVVRLADVMLLAPVSLHLLALVGGFTALFASTVMLTKTSIKVSLAWSTIAQMGFMLMQCGLGAFSSAVLHIVAHALYKAYAFLSSGSIVDEAMRTPGALRPQAGAAATGALVALAVGGAAAIGGAMGFTPLGQPGPVALGAILGIGLAQLVAAAAAAGGPALALRGAALAAGIGVAYFALQAGAARLLAGAVPAAGPQGGGTVDLAVATLAVLSFAGLAVLQAALPALTADPRWRALYWHVANGFHVTAFVHRRAASLLAPSRSATLPGASS